MSGRGSKWHKALDPLQRTSYPVRSNENIAPYAIRGEQMPSQERFHGLFHRPSPAQDVHVALRTSHPSLTMLAESSPRIYAAHMWDRRARHRTVTG